MNFECSIYTSILRCSNFSYALLNAYFGVDGHVMHVRMPNIPGIAMRIAIFQLTETGFSIALYVRLKSQRLCWLDNLSFISYSDVFTFVWFKHHLPVSLQIPTIINFDIIAKRGIIARLSNNTLFRLYEKIRKARFFKYFLTFWPLHKKSHATASCTY